jgi:hypothetical protein
MNTNSDYEIIFHEKIDSIYEFAGDNTEKKSDDVNVTNGTITIDNNWSNNCITIGIQSDDINVTNGTITIDNNWSNNCITAGTVGIDSIGSGIAIGTYEPATANQYVAFGHFTQNDNINVGDFVANNITANTITANSINIVGNGRQDDPTNTYVRIDRNGISIQNQNTYPVVHMTENSMKLGGYDGLPDMSSNTILIGNTREYINIPFSSHGVVRIGTDGFEPNNFMETQPFNHNEDVQAPDNNSYRFALYPESYQPSGSLNYSRPTGYYNHATLTQPSTPNNIVGGTISNW